MTANYLYIYFNVLFISYDKFCLYYTLIHGPTFFPVTGTVGQADTFTNRRAVFLKKR